MDYIGIRYEQNKGLASGVALFFGLGLKEQKRVVFANSCEQLRTVANSCEQKTYNLKAVAFALLNSLFFFWLGLARSVFGRSVGLVY
ncbi:MAG: hypothetical protein J6U02_03940 [Elusimicrobia bacterium]|nr:hypothetical protein [Elusimicrobiota bacterium]